MKTFWRLLGFLRPYRRGVILSFLLAGAAMGVSLLIPYLVGRTVDDIDKGGVNLWPLAIAVVVAGLLRLVFSVARRTVAGVSSSWLVNNQSFSLSDVPVCFAMR